MAGRSISFAQWAAQPGAPSYHHKPSPTRCPSGAELRGQGPAVMLHGSLSTACAICREGQEFQFDAEVKPGNSGGLPFQS
jgi:hypothetical protein